MNQEREKEREIMAEITMHKCRLCGDDGSEDLSALMRHTRMSHPITPEIRRAIVQEYMEDGAPPIYKFAEKFARSPAIITKIIDTGLSGTNMERLGRHQNRRRKGDIIAQENNGADPVYDLRLADVVQERLMADGSELRRLRDENARLHNNTEAVWQIVQDSRFIRDSTATITSEIERLHVRIDRVYDLLAELRKENGS